MKQPILVHWCGGVLGVGELFGGEAFQDYVYEHILASGVNMLLDRHQRRPWFGYPDTKFDPNTGTDLGLAAYERQYSWFLGRGAEAMHRHLTAFSRLKPYLRRPQRARALMEELTDNQIDAILRVHDVNNGRFPMIVDRDGHAIDDFGSRVKVDPDLRSPGDAFCAKALICAGRNDEEVQRGMDLLHQFTSAVLEDRFHMDQLNDDPDMISQGSTMLALAATPYIADRGRVGAWVSTVASLLEFVLSRHYEKQTGSFVEYVSRESGRKYPIFNPGHCAEFACLALRAIRALQDAVPSACATPAVGPVFEQTLQVAPVLIRRSFKLGYNDERGGVFTTVHPRTGAPINNTMPWWSLPEYFRAAVTALTMHPRDDKSDTAAAKNEHDLLRIAAQAHNAYVTHYLNPDFHLFPYQTRDGDSGAVIPVTPAVPEGDPLYHTNLAYLDAMELIETVS